MITRWIAAEGFLPVTKSGLARMSDNAKLKPYLDALPSVFLKAARAGLSARKKTLCFLFFLSGFPALIYQLTWQRALFRIFGVNSESVTVKAHLLGDWNA